MRKREPSYTAGRKCKLAQPLWRTVLRFLKKLKIELPYDPAVPLLGKYPGKNHNLKKYMHSDVHCYLQ